VFSAKNGVPRVPDILHPADKPINPPENREGDILGNVCQWIIWSYRCQSHGGELPLRAGVIGGRVIISLGEAIVASASGWQFGWVGESRRGTAESRAWEESLPWSSLHRLCLPMVRSTPPFLYHAHSLPTLTLTHALFSLLSTHVLSTHALFFFSLPTLPLPHAHSLPTLSLYHDHSVSLTHVMSLWK